MKNCYTKVLLGFLILLGLFLCTNIYTNADDIDVDGLTISKKLTTGEVEHTNRRIKLLGSDGTRKNWSKAHDDLNFWERRASGILQVDDILNYIVFIVKFLGQLGLLVGAGFIMFAGYKYMLSVVDGGKTGNSSAVLKNAIIGVIIVIFSYAIMKILTSIIGLT